MSILTGILTTVLVINCFFLVLLILIQLPKKESGSGLAFGGGTLDMALGAGAGNVLTKLTKASASLFLLLCLVLAVISGTGKRGLIERLAVDGTQPPATPALTAPIEATDKAEGAAPILEELVPPSETPTPAAPEAATPPAAVEKPAETPAAPPKGEEKK